MGKAIVVTSGKGGVGKTTTSSRCDRRCAGRRGTRRWWSSISMWACAISTW